MIKYLDSLKPQTKPEMALLFVLVLSIFSGWPQISVGNATLEPSIAGLVLGVIALFVSLKNPFKHVSFAPWIFLATWFGLGTATALIAANNPSSVLMQLLYLATALVFSYLLYCHLKGKSIRVDWVFNTWFVLAILVAALGILQFILGAFFFKDILREAYQVGVFEFPRVHLFALEPQYYANWLLIPFLVGLYKKEKSPLLIVLLTSILLTLARGSFVALALVLPVVWCLFLRQQKQSAQKLILVFGVSIFIALSLVGLSTTVNSEKSFIHGVGRFLDHASLGVFNKEGATNIEPTVITSSNEPASNHTVNTQPATEETFVNVQGVDSSGAVEASTLGRLEAIRVGFDIINDSPKNMLFGVGLYRFGEVAQQKQPAAYSEDLISNNQYVQVMTETGLIGFSLFFGAITYALILSFKKQYAILRWVMIALLIQFLFFSTYTSFPFWLLLATLLALGVPDKGSFTWQNAKK